MKAQFLQVRNSRFLALTTALSFGISAPALWAQDDHPGHGSSEHPHDNTIANSMSAPLEEAWATVKQSVRDMDTAVQSKNLHGVHVATVKINPAITTLQDHSSMVKEGKAQKLLTALRQLRHCVLRVHRAALDDNQAKAEAEIKNVDSAFEQVEAQDPENTLKVIKRAFYQGDLSVHGDTEYDLRIIFDDLYSEQENEFYGVTRRLMLTLWLAGYSDSRNLFRADGGIQP